MEREAMSHFLRRRNAEVVEAQAVTGNARQQSSLDEAAVAAAMPRFTVCVGIDRRPRGIPEWIDRQAVGPLQPDLGDMSPAGERRQPRMPLPSVYQPARARWSADTEGGARTTRATGSARRPA